MELILSIVAIVISLIALLFELISLIFEKVSLHDQAYDKFSQLWFSMDQVFIEYPYMRKFFYPDSDGNYASIVNDDEKSELAICIAERFCDVFQYTEPWEKYLKKDDRKSYVAYKAMIMKSPAVNELRFKSWC